MEWLRWILLAVGVLVLLGIVVLYLRHRSEQAVVLGEGQDQDAYDPIDAQVRASHSQEQAGERQDPMIDGVGRARVVCSGGPEPEAPTAPDAAPGRTPSGPDLFRQRQVEEPALGDDAPAPDTEPEEVQLDLDWAEQEARYQSEAAEDESAALAFEAEIPEDEHETTVTDAAPSSDAPPNPVVLSLLLVQRASQPFNGVQVQRLIEEIGFSFGDFSIYHFYGDDDSHWFSLMNGVPPGTFDPEDVDSFATPALALFMQLPVAPGREELVFERMLEVARDLADSLDAELLDDRREPISAESIDRYRELLLPL